MSPDYRPRWAEPNHPASLISTQHKQRMIEEFERVAAHAGWSDPRLFALQCQLLWDGATAAAQLNYVKAPVQAARTAVETLIRAAQTKPMQANGAGS